MQFAICNLQRLFAPWRLCVRLFLALGIAIAPLFIVANVVAADNELTPAEKAEGWKLLFDGVSAKGWKNNTKKPVAAKVEHAALNPHGSGGYVLVYDKQFADFDLKCDVKM